MMKVKTRTADLRGTSYDIGYQVGKFTGKIPPLEQLHVGGMDGFDASKVKEAFTLFDRWCPGLTDELHGFADALSVRPEQIFFYGMTYMMPQCSQIAVLPSITSEGKPLLARNYEFSHDFEDFCLVKTAVDGKFTHIGTSALQFGRDDGVNEHGLAVTMSACGCPVAPLPNLRKPQLKGLQHWAVVRALLENCLNVQEGLAYLKGMPIACNINLVLMDKVGNVALFEIMDGKHVIKEIDAHSTEQILWATNHPVLPDLVSYEPKAYTHSIRRYEWIGEQLSGKTDISKNQLKDMLLSKYPNGLCCHYFKEYFGTTKSMVISPVDESVELCWGGREENGWRAYAIEDTLEPEVREIELPYDTPSPMTFEFRDL